MTKLRLLEDIPRLTKRDLVRVSRSRKHVLNFYEANGYENEGKTEKDLQV